MKMQKMLLLACLAFALVSSACKYIVLPEGLVDQDAAVEGSEFKVWTAIVTGVGQSEAGDLHIDITLRNDMGDWSTIEAVAGKPAVLKGGDGKTTQCDTVFVSTGGHRLAPGFQMRGYMTGKKDDAKTQLLYVECKGAAASAGSTLSIDYVSSVGELDYYELEADQVEGTLELNLDEVVADLVYPIAAPVEGLVLPAGTSITGLSENVVTLLDAQRTETGLQFTWQNFNPTKFPLKTHIGTPPVIGEDGIIYGSYETLDMVDVPITPANENMQWTTEVTVPPEVSGLYILLSVESKKPRTYLNYLLDISDK